MKKNILKDKSLEFAIEVVVLFKWLKADKKEYVMSKQLLRSGTAIGALVREAEHAESRADFIHKLSIAQKEANETLYWLELLKRTDYLSESQFQNSHNNATELIKILTSIIKTTKSTNN